MNVSAAFVYNQGGVILIELQDLTKPTEKKQSLLNSSTKYFMDSHVQPNMHPHIQSST